MTCDGATRTLTALNAEWAALTDHAGSFPPAWRLACPTLGAEDGLVDLPQLARRDPDAVLLGLLSLHRAGDAVAGRAVVQLMLPKMVLMATRDERATLDDFLAALWERIATYPLHRRPRRVAANLALDSLKAVKAEQRRREGALPVAPSDPLADALAVLDAGVRLGAISEPMRVTLMTVYVGGRTSRAAAQVLGTSPEAVRQRCSQGVRALKAVAPDLVADLAG